MLRRMAEPTKQTNATAQIAILVAIFVLVLNVAFYFLSNAYFADKRTTMIGGEITDATIQSARVSFVVFSIIIGVAAIAAAFRPRVVGHVLAALIGAASFCVSWYAWSLPKVLPSALLVIGIAMPVLAYFSYDKRLRGAWAFLVATSFTYSLVLFFGAPKVRGKLDISLWTALTFPGLLVVAVVALSLVRRDYREPSTK